MYGELTTLAEVKAWLQLGQGAFPSADDALLTRLIGAASQFVQNWLGRPVGLADYAETRDGSGGRRLQFGVFPVTAVLSLTIDGIAVPPASTSAGRGYVFSPTQLAVQGYFFRAGAQNVAFAYTAGYAAVPVDLAQACIDLVALRYRERARLGEVSKHIGIETVTFAQTDMSAATQSMLQQYRAVSPIAGTAPALAPTATDPATMAGAL
jgi:Phage gp6-like head-tail connector protein